MSGTKNPPRLYSLDALRGLGMLFLLLIGPLVIALARGPLESLFQSNEFLGCLLRQMELCTWDGFTAWDQIMPLFLFIAGAAIPYALARYKKSEGGCVTWRFWFRVLRRFLLLWILGAMLQGNLLSLKLDSLHLYCSPLQAIAVGYLFSALLYVFLSARLQIVVTALLLFGYWGLETFVHFETKDGFGEVGGGTYVCQHTLAEWVDHVVMVGHWNAGGTQAWILPGMTFIVTTMTGVFAGTLTRSHLQASAPAPGGKKEETVPAEKMSVPGTLGVFLKLLLLGVLLGAAGYGWSMIPEETFGYCPLVMSVWTPSMTLLSSGISFLLLALLYLIHDLLRFRLGSHFLTVIGMNALVAYILGTLNNGFFLENINQIFFGTEQYLGAWYPALLTTVHFLVIYFILWALYRCGKFVKV